MKSLRDSVYALVAIGSLAMAVCQPSEAGVDQASQAVDQVLVQLGSALQTAGDATAR